MNVMVNCMLHEPFYTHGTYSNPEKGFFIGYVSIKDSFSDCMPIYNEKKNLILFLTGECYLDEKVINNLKHQGHEFNSRNASYLIHLFEEDGEKFYDRLNGWFSGIILDMKNSTAVLFNDRYGIRRIYYHENSDTFIFSSEAKSLLKAFPILRRVDQRS